MSMLFDQNAEGCCQETVLMAEIELADGNLTAELPSHMGVMPVELVEAYYPYDKCPDIILTDSEGLFQMTFHLLSKKLDSKEIGKAAEAVRAYCDQIYPRNRLMPVHMFEEGELPIGWFTMELEEGEKTLHHIKAVLSHRGRMFLTTATYLEKEHLKWNSVLKHFFTTLHENRSLDESHR